MTSKQFLCQIRKIRVRATPEERIRQGLLAHMVNSLGYPGNLITVELSLQQMPHLATQKKQKLPKRRADILCYQPGSGDLALRPLLLIECKATDLSEAAWRQVIGYNFYVGALFMALANSNVCRIGWQQESEGKYRFANGLPSYKSLTKALKP